jgi:hypothetical protein
MKKRIALALAVAAVSSLGGGGAVYAQAKTTPVGYVSLDINPSIELGVNAFDQVISAEAYNEDGEKILEGTNLTNSNVNDAVGIVLFNAISDGYIKEDGSSAIEITASTDKKSVADKLEESLKEAADKTLDNNNRKAEVETENVALARRNEARQLGITPGKLNLIQKLQELDPTIKVEDYKSSSVKDIQKKTKELRSMNDTTTDDNTTTTDTDRAYIDDTLSTSTSTSNAIIAQESADTQVDNSKKDESESFNNKKEEDSSVGNDKEKDIIRKPEKQNGNGKSNSENNNSNKEENKTTK